MSALSQGGRAVQAGAMYRDAVRQLLTHQGGLTPANIGQGPWPDFPKRVEYAAANLKNSMRSTYTGLVAEDERVGTKVFNTSLEADFVIRRHDWPHALAIFVASQDSSGSTRDKLPGYIEAMRETCVLPFAIVLAGSAFECDAEVAAYARRWQDRHKTTFRRVFIGMGELTTWVISEGMPLPPEIPRDLFTR